MARQVPTVVLVHGAWHGPWVWADVAGPLAAEGIGVRTVDLPSSGPDVAALGGLHDDAAAVRATIDEVDGPVVVVAHSYGGKPVTEGAAGAGNVSHLVYLTSFQLDVGDSLLETVGGQAPDWWLIAEDRRSLLPARPEEIFYNDCSPEATAAAVGALAHQSWASFEETVRAAAWREIPSTYVVCERDNAIPVEAQEAMAARAGDVRRLDAGHSPFLSRPDEVVAIVRSLTA